MSIHQRTATPDLAKTTERSGPPLVATRVERITRAADQLALTIELLNLDVDPRTNTVVQVDRREPFTGVRLGLGSQHTVEDTIATGAATPTDGVDHRTAQDSRLVFPLAPGTRYALDVLLDLAARALSLDDRAVPGATTKNTAEPSTDVTALEVVESLIFSPDPAGRFQAAARPITHADVTELWRARLEPGPAVPTPPGQRPSPPQRPALRAIFTRTGDPVGLDRAVTSAERAQIVAATLTTPGEPILVNRLWLTSQGSFLDLTGAWSGADLTAYRHLSAAGRDLQVEVVARGYLAPFGHPATITTITEREFRPDASGGTSAVLVQGDYLAVGAAALGFPAPHMPFEGRSIPFTDISAVPVGSGPVEHTTLTLSDGRTIDPDKAWAVTRDGADVLVGYTGTDRTGRGDVSFTLPAVFVTDEHAYTVLDTVNGVPTPLGNLADYYADAPARRAVADLGGQTIGWATPDPRGRAGSDRATNLIRVALDRPDPGTTPAAVRADLEQAGRPAFYPQVVHADVVDEATAALIGGNGSAVRVRYADAWLEYENTDSNPGLAFHTLDPVDPVERAGSGAGLVRPALNVTTFSQTLGAGTELTLTTPARDARADDTPRAHWDPAEALADTALLFGRIALASIVDVVNTGLDQLEGERGMPRFEVLLEEDGLHYLMTWEPHLKTFSIAGEPVLVVDKDSRASLRIEQVVPIDNETTAGTELELELEHVTLRLPPALPAIEIDFRSVRYFEPMGGTGQLETDLADWRFIEVLAFLEPVRELVVGLLDLGNIEVGPEGISVDVEVPAPALSFGVIGVTDLTVGLRIDLPNDGDSRIEFNLSRRDDPFSITLLGFGGSGSLELGLLADDLDYLYAELAVTYEAAISLIVVSASLSASLGLELAYEVNKASGEREVTISAYVELAGNASVLGLVNLTGKVLLALRYGLTSQLLQGTAQMSAEVDSIFGRSEANWSQTVEVALGSGDADRDLALTRVAADSPAPSFGERFSPVQWTAYCATFA